MDSSQCSMLTWHNTWWCDVTLCIYVALPYSFRPTPVWYPLSLLYTISQDSHTQHTVMWRHVVQLCCPAVQFQTNSSLVPSLPSVHDQSRLSQIFCLSLIPRPTQTYILCTSALNPLARCCRHVCSTGHTGLGVRQCPEATRCHSTLHIIDSVIDAAW